MEDADCAATIVNICSLLSSLNRHTEALEYAKMAIQKTEGLETTTTMLAYYNAAVESEYLCLWD